MTQRVYDSDISPAVREKLAAIEDIDQEVSMRDTDLETAASWVPIDDPQALLAAGRIRLLAVSETHVAPMLERPEQQLYIRSAAQRTIFGVDNAAPVAFGDRRHQGQLTMNEYDYDILRPPEDITKTYVVKRKSEEVGFGDDGGGEAQNVFQRESLRVAPQSMKNYALHSTLKELLVTHKSWADGVLIHEADGTNPNPLPHAFAFASSSLHHHIHRCHRRGRGQAAGGRGSGGRRPAGRRTKGRGRQARNEGWQAH